MILIKLNTDVKHLYMKYTCTYRSSTWRSVNFSKVAGFKPATLLKLTLLHECFSRFLNCTNVTKSRNAPHIEFMIINITRIREFTVLFS